MAADAHEIHKTPQNTRDQNKTLSVLWACTAPRLKLATKTAEAVRTFLFSRVALSV